MEAYDVIVIGAGGAGMMCALQAGRRGRRVLLLEHTGSPGRKIRISGGGRCNFTNIGASPAQYVSHNPHFCRSAMSRFTPDDFIELVRAHGIAFHEKTLGQLFCDGSSQQIIDLLVKECEAAGVKLLVNCRVSSVERAEQFQLKTDQGSFSAASLVIATGGLSLPKIGATDFGYRIAKQFGLKIRATAPALDAFVFSPKDAQRFDELAGVSAPAIVTCEGASFREAVLFTHTGLSGPAALQASLYWSAGKDIEVDLLPERSAEELLAWFAKQKAAGSRASVKTLLAQHLPKRLAEAFCDLYRVKDIPLAQQPVATLEALCQGLKPWRITPRSTVGYRTAEVTRGGVDTDELSSKTMECKKVPGLYFIGEVVDVTGWLGGYNFQWAWASGWAAGQAV